MKFYEIQIFKCKELIRMIANHIDFTHAFNLLMHTILNC